MLLIGKMQPGIQLARNSEKCNGFRVLTTEKGGGRGGEQFWVGTDSIMSLSDILYESVFFYDFVQKEVIKGIYVFTSLLTCYIVDVD